MTHSNIPPVLNPTDIKLGQQVKQNVTNKTSFDYATMTVETSHVKVKVM
jgi:hypothetical protein